MPKDSSDLIVVVSVFEMDKKCSQSKRAQLK